MTDATGTSSFAYNTAGRLVSETNGAGAAIGYAYDNVGQLTAISYPGERVVSYDYDAAGQLTSLDDWSSNTTEFTWTADGQLATQTTPDGVTQANGYDLAGQLTSITDATPADPLAEFHYTFDAAGQISGASSTLAGDSIAFDYGYDPISQLASVTTTPAGGSASMDTFDATPAGLLAATVGGASLAYNTAQQVTSLTPVVGAGTAFAYDGRGSRVSSTSGTDVTAYAYSASGALASVTTPSASVSYTSDARNLRQSRTVGTETEQFTWSSVGGLPLLLDDGEHSYLYGASSTPLAQVDDATGEVEYLHSDLLGTPRLVTDADGNVAGTVSFDAYGNRTAHAGVQSAIGFTGNWAEDVTGLLYLRARDYDPATGQFLTVDPAVDSTRQPYAYTGNNPVQRTDPTGLDAESDLAVAILTEMAISKATFGVSTVVSYLNSGDDMWTALNETYNPVLIMLNGYSNEVRDYQDGAYWWVVALDGAQGALGLVSTVAVATGGGSAAGSLARLRAGTGGSPTSGVFHGTTMTDEASFKFHFEKHGAGRTALQYAADARAWTKNPTGVGVQVALKDGSMGTKYRTKGCPGGILDANGRLITFWYK